MQNALVANGNESNKKCRVKKVRMQERIFPKDGRTFQVERCQCASIFERQVHMYNNSLYSSYACGLPCDISQLQPRAFLMRYFERDATVSTYHLRGVRNITFKTFSIPITVIIPIVHKFICYNYIFLFQISSVEKFGTEKGKKL